LSRYIKRPKKPKAVKKKRGRPKAEINLKQVERLSELLCTHEELATYFRVSISTIKRLAATPEGGEAIERGRNLGKISLRRQQFRLLRKGSNTMAIWLGKQYLGQRDKVEQTLRTPPGEAFRIEAEVSDRRQAILLNELFSPDEIAAAHQKMLERERAAQAAAENLTAAAADHGETPKVQ
jgi:hypothetical protein